MAFLSSYFDPENSQKKYVENYFISRSSCLDCEPPTAQPNLLFIDDEDNNVAGNSCVNTCNVTIN